MNLALFDFDGTLTTKDSLQEFIIFAVGKTTYYSKLILFSPIFVLYKLKLMHNSTAKELLFQLYFKGIQESEFKQIALEFSQQGINPILRDTTYHKLQEHKKHGDRVIVVSASMKCWLEPWTQKEGIELLSTELEFTKGIFNGKFKTLNCHGKEKLRRVKELLQLDDYEKIYTYGDSEGDREILDIADVKVKL
ncbi:MAG: haloacid dehalogenase-like hydrolase [Campylobacterales bacterium]|nr:haloacid dehalogenase-like hydrolase [Campylobacterales bacterium]